MSDGEDGNVVNLHLSQNGQDGEAGGQSGSKDQNERKRKMPDEGFWDHENNSSSKGDTRKSKSKKKSLKGHKRSKRKRSSYSSSRSESSSDDDEERSKPKSEKHKTSNLEEAMFHVQTEEEKNGYNLPKKLLKHTDHYLKKFIPDKELKDSILTENLPKNFMKLPSLDVFIRDTMKEEHWNYELTMDSVLEKYKTKLEMYLIHYQEFGLTYKRWPLLIKKMRISQSRLI